MRQEKKMMNIWTSILFIYNSLSLEGVSVAYWPLTDPSNRDLEQDISAV